MRISVAGLDFLKKVEGVRLKAYPDPGTRGAPWTIGVGHTKGVKEGDTCTNEQAFWWLAADTKDAEDCINAKNLQLTQNQFDALVSFVFNLGCGNFNQSTLLRKLRKGDVNGAAQEFARWNVSAGRVMDGLTKRRKAEAKLFLTPTLENVP